MTRHGAARTEHAGNRNRLPNCRVAPAALVLLLCVGAATGEEAQRVVAQTVSPHFREPGDNTFPAGYVDKGDTAVVESLFVADGGTPWFRLRVGPATVWTPTATWRYVWETRDQDGASGGSASDDEDRKRRIRLLRDHQDWPRRIVRAIREGKVCLGMSGEQLAVCWGEPLQKGTMFTVGMGRYETWVFRGSDERMVLVNLDRDRVIGWSE